MSTTADEGIASGQVWMREDGHLAITVPYAPCRNQSDKIVRHRLLEGLAKRWPTGPIPEDFSNKVNTAPLEIMEEASEPGRACTQYGVVLT